MKDAVINYYVAFHSFCFVFVESALPCLATSFFIPKEAKGIFKIHGMLHPRTKEEGCRNIAQKVSNKRAEESFFKLLSSEITFRT